MRKISNIGKGLFLGAIVATMIIAVAPTSSQAAFRPCGFGIQCLDVWNPVICPNGKVYSNACYAARACQTGCVPY